MQPRVVDDIAFLLHIQKSDRQLWRPWNKVSEPAAKRQRTQESPSPQRPQPLCHCTPLLHTPLLEPRRRILITMLPTSRRQHVCFAAFAKLWLPLSTRKWAPGSGD